MISSSAQHQIRHSICFRTSGTYLRRLLPFAFFSFHLPKTIFEASAICCSLNNMAWLGGIGYNHCGFSIHGVQYATRSGEILHRAFSPVLFANLTDPIVTGRDELVAPKLGFNKGISQDKPGAMTQIEMSWRGRAFARLDFDQPTTKEQYRDQPNGSPAPATRLTPAQALSVTEVGMLMYRYRPAVGGAWNCKR